MSDQLKSTIHRLADTANVTGMVVISAAAAAATIATVLASAGALPWLQLQAGFGATVYENAGPVAQLALTALLLLLCVFLPAARRVMRLETSHRRFAVSMNDVAQAYSAVHAADRAGLFSMSSEYDAVRERMRHLRDHPELETLEPEVLELAAQMSQVSQDLAQTYSDEKVARARNFLHQRQQELDRFNTRLDRAKQVTAELKNWASAVEMDESIAQSEITRLRESLAEILPELDGRKAAKPGKKVVSLAKVAAE